MSNECNIIIGGDWNVIQNAILDKSGGKKNVKTKSLDIIDQLKTKYDLEKLGQLLHIFKKYLKLYSPTYVLICIDYLSILF